MVLSVAETEVGRLLVHAVHVGLGVGAVLTALRPAHLAVALKRRSRTLLLVLVLLMLVLLLVVVLRVWRRRRRRGVAVVGRREAVVDDDDVGRDDGVPDP